MRVFSKFIETAFEPEDKNVIWFDGYVFRIYKNGEWRTITLTEEATDRIIEYAKSVDIYVMVKELPEFGEKGKIYVLQTIVGDSIELSEHVWENDSWKLVGNFNSVSLVLDNELSETSHNAVANRVITEALNTKVNKSELATPDWNASEGEEGYIKNRTHYFNELAFVKFSTLSYRHDTANQILEIDTNRDPEVAYINNSGTYLRFSYTESIDIDDLGLDIYLGDNGTTTSVYIDYSNCGDSFDYIIGILNSTSFAFSYDESDVVLKLNELFIPDTIARKEYVNERIEDIEVFVEDLQSTKIDKEADDYYPQLAVGLADNLSGVDVVDSEVNFRRSGGGAISDGVARIEAIKGNSVVWNQVYKPREAVIGTRTDKGVTFTVTADGSVTAQGTSEAATNASSYIQLTANQPFLSSHIYMLVAFGAPAGRWSYMGLYFGGINDINSLSMIGSEGYKIFSPPVDGMASLTLSCWGGQTIDCSLRPQFYDLTQMFGAGNEPTTIEEFYQRIPMGIEDENAYNEGEIIDMNVQSIESQGVNAWDEEWEVGSIGDNNGNLISSSSTIRSKNYIKAIGGNEYYFGYFGNAVTWGRVHYYDAEKNRIGSIAKTVNASSFIPPLNCAYMKFRMGDGYGTTYKNDICINLSDTSINGKYFPYVKRTEDLSIIRKYFPNGMKSAGTAHDEIRYNKATQKWEMVQRIGEVDLGSYRYYKDSSRVFFKYIADDFIIGKNYLCPRYDNILNAELGSKTGIHLVIEEKRTVICISDLSYDGNTSQFQSDIQGVKLYYELAEPIVTELDAEDQFKDLDYQVWNLGTEKAIADGKSAPLAADITYGFNAIGQIKELRAMVEAMQAKLANMQ